MIQRFVALGPLVLCCGIAAAAGAEQQTPAPSPPPIDLPTLPQNSQIAPYVKMGIDFVTGLIKTQAAAAQNAARGNVSYFKRFEMQVETGPNAYRAVHLHRGTVIDPRGASIEQGQRVAVSGIAQPDGSLDANVVTILR